MIFLKKQILIALIFLFSFLIGIKNIKAYTIGGNYNLTTDIENIRNNTEFNSRIDEFDKTCAANHGNYKYYYCGIGFNRSSDSATASRTVNSNAISIFNWNDPDIKMVTLFYEFNSKVYYLLYLYNPNGGEVNWINKYYINDAEPPSEFSFMNFESTYSYDLNSLYSAVSLDNKAFDKVPISDVSLITSYYRTNQPIYFTIPTDNKLLKDRFGSGWEKANFYETITRGNRIIKSGDILSDSLPTITFNAKNNKENINGEMLTTSVDLTIDFKSINNNKYIYQASYDNGKNWETYTLDDTTLAKKTILNNGTIIARILSIEDNSVVTSSTYTIDNITNTSISSVNLIDNTKNTEYCFMEIEGKKQQVCFNLVAEFINLDTSKYNYYISDNNGTNFKIIENLGSLSSNMKAFNLFKEGTYVVKIEDKEGNYVDSKSMTLKYPESIENLGQKIILDYEFNKDGCNLGDSLELCSVVYIYTLFLNVDITKYNYFYTIDQGRNWININEEVKNGDFFNYETQENITFIAKVEDKKGNYITSANVIIDYTELLASEDNNPLKDVFNFVKEKIYTKLPIIEQLGNIYNSFQYIDGIDTPPVFKFDMSFIGGGVYNINLNFDSYRSIYFGYIKIFFALYTVFAVLNEVKNIIGGGD